MNFNLFIQRDSVTFYLGKIARKRSASRVLNVDTNANRYLSFKYIWELSYIVFLLMKDVLSRRANSNGRA